MILDSLDPPTGRLRVTSGDGPGRDEQPDVPFTGWLGLLRAGYGATRFTCSDDGIRWMADVPCCPGTARSRRYRRGKATTAAVSAGRSS